MVRAKILLFILCCSLFVGTLGQAQENLFWIEGLPPANVDISRSNLDGTGRLIIIPKTPGSHPTSLVVDHVNSKLYWSDQLRAIIFRSNFDGTGVQPARATQSPPFEIAIDPVRDRIFWSEGNRIRRAVLSNPADVGVIVREAPLNILFKGLTLILAQQKIIWSELNQVVPGGNIWAADYDGNAPLLLQGNDLRPREGLRYDHITNRIYWTDQGLNAVVRSFASPAAPREPMLIGSEARGVALNIGANKLFVKTTDGILRSDLDGSNGGFLLGATEQTGIALNLACGTAAPDTDGDSVPDCIDGCAADPDSLQPGPGSCGCGFEKLDDDADGTPNCLDACPQNAAQNQPGPGTCPCGFAQIDADFDTVPDCLDLCPSEAGDPARSGCTEAIVLRPGLVLQIPPIVEVNDNDVTITMQQFDTVSLEKAAKKELEAAKKKKKKKGKTNNAKPGFFYTTEVQPVGGKKKDRQVKVSKRNRVTFKNLKKGDYHARYKVTITRDKEPAGNTSYSPSSSFSIR